MRCGRTSTYEQGQSVPARPRSPHDCELNHVLPQTRRLPASTLPLRTWRPFIQTTNGTATGLVGVGNRVLPPRIAGDRLRHVRRRSRNFLAARVEPGSQSRRDSAERYPCFVGGLHSSRMETQHGKFFPEEPT
jgi:hypothetical protein